MAPFTLSGSRSKLRGAAGIRALEVQMDDRRSPDGRGRELGELERLITAEARITDRLEQAAAEARHILDSARDRAEAARSRSGEEQEEAMGRLEQEMHDDRTRQLRAIAEDLDRSLGSLQAVTEERLTELAKHALSRLLHPASVGLGS
jgi:hypothetical protein